MRRCTQVVLEARPNEYYFQPKCISCLACFDANGLWRGDALKNETCDGAGSCTYIHAAGCPEFCRGHDGGKPLVAAAAAASAPSSIRRWEATAPHHVAIFSGGYAAENCSSPRGGRNASGVRGGAVQPGCASAEHGAISAVPPWLPGGGLFEGFFVAPRAANYTFHSFFDTGAELWLSDNGDPRLAKLALGGEASPAPADGDEINGYTRWGTSWYRMFSDERVAATRDVVGDLTWSEAQAHCGRDGGKLARIGSAEETSFVKTLPWFQRSWIGLSDAGREGRWHWADATGAELAGSAVKDKNLFENWASWEPNGDGDCGEIYWWGAWNDRACSGSFSFLCEVEDPAALGVSATYHLDEGEARYFELLHVHNDSVAGPLLGLSLLIEPDDGSTPFHTRVDGDQSLSMEFFRVASTAAPALPVHVEVGDSSGARLAAACVAASPGSDVEGGQGCAFEYDADLTPTLDAVVGAPRGRAGAPIVLRGSGFGKLATMVSVGIGGAKCEVVWANETYVECALDEAKATAGTFPVVVDVEGWGLARHVNPWFVNYTINLEIDSVLPLNGSRVGGTEITISGSGFARLGPMQKVLVDGVACVPKTLKNLACRVSECVRGRSIHRVVACQYLTTTTQLKTARVTVATTVAVVMVVTRYDSGQPCAWTAGDEKGYAMAASPYADFYETRADAQLKYYAEWYASAACSVSSFCPFQCVHLTSRSRQLVKCASRPPRYDFSTTTRIVCVLSDLLGGNEPLVDANDTVVNKGNGGAKMVRDPDARKPDSASGVVNVTLPAAEQIVDEPSRTVEQDLPALIERQLVMATRDLYCVTLLGYRIWNVAYQGGDCVLWNDKYNDDGTFGDHLVFNGSSKGFGEDEAVGGVIPRAKMFEFMDELTPVISKVTPTFGSAGQIVTIHGRGFAPTREVWDTNWYVAPRAIITA